MENDYCNGGQLCSFCETKNCTKEILSHCNCGDVDCDYCSKHKDDDLDYEQLVERAQQNGFA